MVLEGPSLLVWTNVRKTAFPEALDRVLRDYIYLVQMESTEFQESTVHILVSGCRVVSWL
jgi:hypothetical protein